MVTAPRQAAGGGPIRSPSATPEQRACHVLNSRTWNTSFSTKYSFWKCKGFVRLSRVSFCPDNFPRAGQWSSNDPVFWRYPRAAILGKALAYHSTSARLRSPEGLSPSKGVIADLRSIIKISTGGKSALDLTRGAQRGEAHLT